MNKFLIFISGLTVGAVGSYFVTKHVMRQQTEAEIQSVKDAFKQIAEEERKELMDKTEASAKDNVRKYGGSEEDVKAVDQNAHKEADTDPTDPIERTKNDQAAPWDHKKHLEPKEGEPYCITMDEYGEADNEIVNLTYYADGILVYDDTDEIIRHPDEVVGKENLYHFGEFEPDMLYVRDPVESIDYAIALSDKPYKG